MDLKITDENNKFKCRVCGVVLNNNKVLGLEMNDNGFFCCPGGHVHLGEDSSEAVMREMKEETGLDFKIVKLLTIVENFFTSKDNKKFHEISFYYLVKAQDFKGKDKDFTLVENDEGKIMNMNYRWFDIDKLNEIDFRPSILTEKLQKHNFEFEHIIYHQ